MSLWLNLLPYVVSTLGLIASLGLFSGLSRRIRRSAKSAAACETLLQSEAAQLTNVINDLKRRIAELEHLETRTSSDPQSGSDISGAVRGRVFRLHRAGQAPDDIAKKLRLSKGEVELLIKAQRIVMRPYESEMAVAGAEKG
jgi:hypothetical protein